jgi:hypothetical protein
MAVSTFHWSAAILLWFKSSAIGQLRVPPLVHRPAISWLSVIDREPRTLPWVRLSGRLWAQSSCLFGYDFSPDAVIARP